MPNYIVVCIPYTIWELREHEEAVRSYSKILGPFLDFGKASTVEKKMRLKLDPNNQPKYWVFTKKLVNIDDL
jgi:hypothetical protein